MRIAAKLTGHITEMYGIVNGEKIVVGRMNTKTRDCQIDIQEVKFYKMVDSAKPYFKMMNDNLEMINTLEAWEMLGVSHNALYKVR